MSFSLYDLRFKLLLTTVLFLVPLHVYVIGDWLGQGLQWALLRFQQSAMGPCVITLARDLEYVSMGIYTGRSAFMVYLWLAGVLVLVAAMCLLLVMVAEERDLETRFSGLLIVSGGFFFLASCVAQYGPLLNGPAGISIPIGVPLVWAVGWVVYRDGGIYRDKEGRVEEGAGGREGEMEKEQASEGMEGFGAGTIGKGE